MKHLIISAILLPFVGISSASYIITGVIDGDLSGGNPKAVVLTAIADISDTSTFGFGSANNGTGSDGEEFTFPIGTATTGDVVIITTNAANVSFFEDNFADTFTLFIDGASNINGDDAIELFSDGSVIDTYGEIDVDGSGQSWEYTDGFAVRIGGAAGTFDQGNYTSSAESLVDLDEAAQASVIADAFGFTPVPEPSVSLLLGVAGLGLIVRRRRLS